MSQILQPLTFDRAQPGRCEIYECVIDAGALPADVPAILSRSEDGSVLTIGPGGSITLGGPGSLLALRQGAEIRATEGGGFVIRMSPPPKGPCEICEGNHMTKHHSETMPL
jgi:hypothetical protein